MVDEWVTDMDRDVALEVDQDWSGEVTVRFTVSNERATEVRIQLEYRWDGDQRILNSMDHQRSPSQQIRRRWSTSGSTAPGCGSWNHRDPWGSRSWPQKRGVSCQGLMSSMARSRCLRSIV